MGWTTITRGKRLTAARVNEILLAHDERNYAENGDDDWSSTFSAGTKLTGSTFTSLRDTLETLIDAGWYKITHTDYDDYSILTLRTGSTTGIYKNIFELVSGETDWEEPSASGSSISSDLINEIQDVLNELKILETFSEVNEFEVHNSYGYSHEKPTYDGGSYRAGSNISCAAALTNMDGDSWTNNMIDNQYYSYSGQEVGNYSGWWYGEAGQINCGLKIEPRVEVIGHAEYYFEKFFLTCTENYVCLYNSTLSIYNQEPTVRDLTWKLRADYTELPLANFAAYRSYGDLLETITYSSGTEIWNGQEYCFDISYPAFEAVPLYVVHLWEGGDTASSAGLCSILVTGENAGEAGKITTNKIYAQCIFTYQ